MKLLAASPPPLVSHETLLPTTTVTPVPFAQAPDAAVAELCKNTTPAALPRSSAANIDSRRRVIWQ